MVESSKSSGENADQFRFGDQAISASQVFIARKHVYAMVSPCSPYTFHVLICPTRVVARFTDLTELETIELFVCAKEIAKKFEDQFNKKYRSFSYVIQDGGSAGSKVRHVHI